MNMNTQAKIVFSHIKPLCDAVMKQPTERNLSFLQEALGHIPEDIIKEMQYYILFPIVANLRSIELQNKQELQCRLVETMSVVLQKSVVTSSEIFSKYHNCLMNLVFDKTQPGMVSNVPEELKLSVTRCLTIMMLNIDVATRLKILQTLQPLLAQAIFVAVHIAKLEKLRALRLSAINCVTAYTATHEQFTKGYEIIDKQLESAAVPLISSILPGVVAALQDVAVSSDNPGHAVIVCSLSAIHRIVCLVMNDKHVEHKTVLTTEDFVKLFQNCTRIVDSGDKNKTVNKDKSSKSLVQSPDWFAMAGDKLKLVTASLKYLQAHEHRKVRMELAVFASRILLECSRTMQPSISHLLEILILLSEDEYKEVSSYCQQKIDLYFNTLPIDVKYKTFDNLSDSFLAHILALPRILNNIDNSRKLAALDLVYGYLTMLCDEGRPQRLSRMLTIQHTLVTLCRTLVEAVRMDSWIGLMALTNVKYIATEPPSKCSWCKLRHLDDAHTVHRLTEICCLLGGSECSDLVVDQLLEMFHENSLDRKEIVYLLNYIASAPNSNIDLVNRVLDTYIEVDVWYLPLDIGSSEAPLTSEDTLDISVYNPRSWDKDHVPGLYEGAVETRYTDISYQQPKVRNQRDPDRCATLAESQNNMLICCALTYGVGLMATRLKDNYQPYLLKTLCILLERVGSKYLMLHEAGVHASTMVAHACGLKDVTQLIQGNTDYFTYQVTVRLKKAWNSQSALEILAVVMEYSDVGMFRCLYGIVADVLVQSCDKYHRRDLSGYMQVFLTFLTCMRRWFPAECPTLAIEERSELNIFQSLIDYERNKMEADRLLSEKDEIVENGEEMFKEHLKEEELEYGDCSDEKVPPPQHITLTVTILKRCLNFIPSKRREEKLLALQIIEQGLRMLRPYENELLPIVHSVWSPLVVRFAEINEPVVVRRAFELLLTMAEVSKDFISSRTVKEVLPNVYKYLHTSSQQSYLKDKGSAYRHSQAYKLQVTVLTALPDLVACLNLDDKNLDDALYCVQTYLNRKQPKPLQDLAVIFFKKMLIHDDGATWHHLRKFCNNQCVLESNVDGLEVIVGTADCCDDKDYCSNVQLIFK